MRPEAISLLLHPGYAPPSRKIKPRERHAIMSRILDVSPDQLTPEQTKIFEQLVAGRGHILGPYRVWIHSPTIASGMEQIDTFLNKRSTLSQREVEMVIIMIATHWQGDYVQTAHVRAGKQVGLSQAVIDALIAGFEPPLDRRARKGGPAFRGRHDREPQGAGRGIRRTREGPRPARHRGGAGADRLLHVGRDGDEGARGANPGASLGRPA
jgi:hypothetical protein